MEELICIVCPNGCHLYYDAKTNKVSGNLCPRGEKFLLQELKEPKRTISTTVKTIFKECPVLPCRVSNDIPKDKIFECMKEINKVVVDHKIKRGDIIIKNILNLGVDVIATSSKLMEVK